jgi:sigma-B regulation protein RsbU (phosphoserine phosphatase)
LGEGGFPIGLLPEAPYQQFNVTLSAGDRLLLYSDGFIEAALPEGKMLEEHGLKGLIEQARHLNGRAFLDAIYNGLWCRLPDAHQLDDDVSAIMLEYGGL